MKKLTGLILLGGMLLSAHAATIDWTTNPITGYATDILTNGTTVVAVSGTADGVTTSPTINGVTFNADGSYLAGSWGDDPWTNVVYDAGYDDMLATIDFESSGTGPFTITLPGLTVGVDYIIQYWYADSDWTKRNRTMTFDGAGDTALNGVSYATGTFTADAATQDLVVTASHNGPRMTGFQLRGLAGHIEADPIIDLSETSLLFGDSYLGSTNSMTLTVKNVGGDVLEGTASVSAPFFIESGEVYSLSNGQAQVVTVLFAPQTLGEVTESLSFTGGGGESISVSGTGVSQPAPSIGLSVTNLAFTTVSLGETKSLTVTVQNVGGETLVGTASVAAPFSIESGADYSLGLGEEQDVVVLFAPVSDGDFSETLSFTGGGGSNITVSGTGELIIGTIVADIAGDYTGPSAEPEGWDYLYSDIAVGGTEVALTPDQRVATAYDGGNTGFGDPTGENGIPGVLGSVTGSGQYEIFSDGYDGNSKSDGNLGVPGVDLLMHPGTAASNAYVIVRYTFTATDLADSTVVDISGSFREEVGKTVAPAQDSIVAAVYHNADNLFTATGAAGRLWQADGIFDIADLEVAVGDTISFVVGNNGVATGDETALTGKIVVQSVEAPVLIPDVEVVDGNIEFQITGAIGVHYQVVKAESLTTPIENWDVVQDINPLIVSPMDISLPTTNSAAFYKVKYIP